MKIGNEIFAHPKEREAFNKSDVDNISGDEKEELKSLLIERISEGDFRCGEPLEWLLKDDLETELRGKLKNMLPKEHGFTYIPAFLCEQFEKPEYIKLMIEGIKGGEPEWSGRRMALGMYAKKYLPEEEFKKVCWELVCHDSNFSMRKFSARKLIDMQLDDPSIDNIEYINIKLEVTPKDPLEKEKLLSDTRHTLNLSYVI